MLCLGSGNCFGSRVLPPLSKFVPTLWPLPCSFLALTDPMLSLTLAVTGPVLTPPPAPPQYLNVWQDAAWLLGAPLAAVGLCAALLTGSIWGSVLLLLVRGKLLS